MAEQFWKAKGTRQIDSTHKRKHSETEEIDELHQMAVDVIERVQVQVPIFHNTEIDCGCSSITDEVNCLQYAENIMAKYGRSLGIEDQPPAFHLQHIKPGTAKHTEIVAQCATDKDVFTILDVFNVENICTLSSFTNFAEHLRTTGVETRETVLYHMTQAPLALICQTGLDPSRSHRGFFGNGTYLTDSLIKANDYCAERGKPHLVRAVLQCRVLLGKVKVYNIGHINIDLKTAPTGFDSVKGFIRRGYEYVAYRSEQIYIQRIILYKYNDGANELTPCADLPPELKDNTVFITVKMALYFSKFKQFAGGEDSPKYVAVNVLISKLIKHKSIDIDTFIKNLGDLGIHPPDHIAADIRTEFAKCTLTSSTRR